MECNRDEAIRAKTIAEKKLTEKDYAGAKKFTLKAQTLFPGLDGISQMLITINVYISSENKVNGESDWYGVLDVNPSDDDETIRKQYRKLLLTLHPDKNKSIGADGAFKIVSEAWSLLSDKAKRLAYNHRRNLRGLHQKVSFQTVHPSSSSSSSSASPGVNRVHSSKLKTGPSRAPPTVPVRARARARAPPPTPVVNGSETFWTICLRCKMQYEYFKMYLNHTLLCPSCHKPFHAVETAAPANFPKAGGGQVASGSASLKQEADERLKRQCEEFNNAQRLLKRRKEENGGQSSNTNSNIRMSTTNVIEQKQVADERLKRRCEEFNAQRLFKRRKEENGGQSSNVKIPSYARN